MASIQRRGKRWRAVIRRTGHPTQLATLPTKAAAEAWARGIEAEMDQAKFCDVRSFKKTAAQLFERYADEVSPHKKGKRWEKIRLTALGRAACFGKPVNKITRQDIISWRDSRCVSDSTIRRDMVLLNSVFNHAKKEWGLPVLNPLEGVSKPADNPARNRRPTAAELGAIRAHFQGKRMALLVELAIETAMRLGELCSLEWADVHLDKRYVHLRHTKNGDERKVPLSKHATKLLTVAKVRARMLGETRLFSFSALSAGVYWREAMKVLEIEDLHFHDLRHEATTRLSTKLVNVLELAAVTGHRDLKMLQRYYNPSPTDLAKKLG